MQRRGLVSLSSRLVDVLQYRACRNRRAHSATVFKAPETRVRQEDVCFVPRWTLRLGLEAQSAFCGNPGQAGKGCARAEAEGGQPGAAAARAVVTPLQATCDEQQVPHDGTEGEEEKEVTHRPRPGTISWSIIPPRADASIPRTITS